MVDVVEAMIGSGPAVAEARASTSRLRSRTSGTHSKMTGATTSAAAASSSRTTETRLHDLTGRALGKEPEARHGAQRHFHLANRLLARTSESDVSRCFTSTMVTLCPA